MRRDTLHPDVVEAGELLTRLLSERTVRERLASGALYDEVSPHGRRALASIDQAQLDRAAMLVVRDLKRRRRRGAPPLPAMYARSLAEVDIDETLARFVRSPAYRAHRELPHPPYGTCVEEAFFLFLDAEAIGDRSVRQRERLLAVATALVVQPRPAFEVPAVFRQVRSGWVALGPGPALIGALDGRLVHGPVTPLIADAFETLHRPGVKPPPRAAGDAWERVLERLEVMGLAPPPSSRTI